MKRIYVITTDDPARISAIKSELGKMLESKVLVVVDPLLATTSKSEYEHTKRTWLYIVLVDDNGQASIIKLLKNQSLKETICSLLD